MLKNQIEILESHHSPMQLTHSHGLELEFGLLEQFFI
jgi:hypothetical protein